MAQRMLDLQGGKALIQSEQGNGARFIVTLPYLGQPIWCPTDLIYTERVNHPHYFRRRMERVYDFLVEQPLLLLFMVAAIGYAIGEIRIKGTGLGVAAVLFVGLFFGALDVRLTLPPVIVSLGLVLFVYTVGLASGPGFFASFSRSGLRDNLMVIVMLVAAAGIVIVEHFMFGFKPSISAGIFTGALTNTPALAQVASYITHTAPPDIAKVAAAEPVVGYSVSYPMGVIGPMIAIVVMRRLWLVDYRKDAERVRDMFPVEQEIYNRTVRVTNNTMTGVPLSALAPQKDWKVIFGRMKRGGALDLVTGDTLLQSGDLVSVIGTPEDVDAVVTQLGEPAQEQLDLDRSAYDFRRVFMSNRELVGKKLADLDLPLRFGDDCHPRPARRYRTPCFG